MIQGQMLITTERGRLLSEKIKELKPKTILEIGTWKGLGSTKCIIDSIGEGCNFISLESNPEFYNIAKNNLSQYSDKFTLLHGTIVTKNEITNFVSDKDLTNEQKVWLSEDLENLDSCKNVYEELPNEIDFLFLDGGEFSTYPEWLKLKDRSQVVALDDITQLKTKQIYTELLLDKNYDMISYTEDGNGFCIFSKK